jgi:hypothetical protein
MESIEASSETIAMESIKVSSETIEQASETNDQNQRLSLRRKPKTLNLYIFESC